MTADGAHTAAVDAAEQPGHAVSRQRISVARDGNTHCGAARAARRGTQPWETCDAQRK